MQVSSLAGDAFRSITVRGFRSIRAIEELPLRPINILIGANGSGKSNLLGVFYFLSELMDTRKNAYLAQMGGANAIFHYGSRITQEIDVSMVAKDGAKLSATAHFAVPDDMGATVTWDGLTGGRPTFIRYQFGDTGVYSPIKKTNQVDDNRFLRHDAENLAALLYLLKQKHPASYAAIRETVQLVAPFFVDFDLQPLALNSGTIKLEWRHSGSDRYFDASSLSDGTLRFIALATLFLQPVEVRPSVILVDEPELGLHPYAIGLLASLIRQASTDTQIIVATQSPLLVDYFDPEDVLVADRVDGATEIKRLESNPLEEWLTEYSLGQLWEKGELAGRPARE